MNWIPLTSISQIDEIAERSKEIPCVIFKHSSRCGISAMAKFRLKGDWGFAEGELEAFFLDLISYRDVSDAVEEKFSIRHESPQLLVIQDGNCTCHASHLDISLRELKSCLKDRVKEVSS